MQTRFLLGPAGSGKTFRCLEEIRAELRTSPKGASLILVAPKQATFQLERQLLADESLAGYTRLQILSFERLADFILQKLQKSPAKLLAEEGRIMALRALLLQKRSDLKLFRASARLPGFVQQLNLLLREFQRHHFSPQKLSSLSENVPNKSQLNFKLHDLALILSAYLDWLKDHNLQDADSLIDLATAAQQEKSNSKTENRESKIHLWLDGFAEMTPQEIGLLAAIIPHCEKATLAFCLEDLPRDKLPWLSIWSVIGQTFRQCHQKLAALPGNKIEVEVLTRESKKNRFVNNPVLRHLEEFWTEPKPYDAELGDSLRVAICANPEAEAILAAREVLRFVRNGGRYREVAVLLRQLNGYNDVLRRVFTRYEIPFFLDRREPVAHHPLAELTRSALRMLAFNWQHDDFFGALKTGLVNDHVEAIDQLENEALARGWKGLVWLQPLQNFTTKKSLEFLEKLRQRLVPSFQQLADDLGILSQQNVINGKQLATGLKNFWGELDIEKKLEKWSESDSSNLGSTHATVWQQMNAWLDNLELAFSGEALVLSEWLPILESGLSSLTVGIIPPALDQVMIGAIDRSRNPDLKLALVLGLNESVFPAAPSMSGLLTEPDRAELEKQNIFLGPNSKQLLSRERFYGYIACTRSRERLVLTCSTRDAAGKMLNPSPFFGHFKKLFPQLEIENFSPLIDWRKSEHESELITPLLKNHLQIFSNPTLAALEALPVFADVLAKGKQVAEAKLIKRLLPGAAEKIYGSTLQTSVSGLEDFSACAFKFFIARGLRAEERKQFEIDPREKGSFQHEALNQFHRNLAAEKKQWRDLSPTEARERIRGIGEELIPAFRDGLFLASGSGQFTARAMITRLEKLMEVLVGWMPQYDFNPYAVEVGFGLKESVLPAWRIDLEKERALSLRGRIDRIDLSPVSETEALAVVIDYKSSARKLNITKLHHGLELQLLSYLGVLRQLAEPQSEFNVSRLHPAGVFYVNLKGGAGSGKTRNEVLNDIDATGAYQHFGRFDGEALSKFDNRGVPKGNQFNYSINKDKSIGKNSPDALPRDEFLNLINDIENHLRRIGQAIFDGEVSPSPFRINSETACDFCKYRPICRFDSWTESFRVLRPPPKNKVDSAKVKNQKS